jgi:hypothetical protein
MFFLWIKVASEITSQKTRLQFCQRKIVALLDPVCPPRGGTMPNWALRKVFWEVISSLKRRNSLGP